VVAICLTARRASSTEVDRHGDDRVARLDEHELRLVRYGRHRERCGDEDHHRVIVQDLADLAGAGALGEQRVAAREGPGHEPAARHQRDGVRAGARGPVGVSDEGRDRPAAAIAQPHVRAEEGAELGRAEQDVEALRAAGHGRRRALVEVAHVVRVLAHHHLRHEARVLQAGCGGRPGRVARVADQDRGSSDEGHADGLHAVGVPLGARELHGVHDRGRLHSRLRHAGEPRLAPLAAPTVDRPHVGAHRRPRAHLAHLLLARLSAGAQIVHELGVRVPGQARDRAIGHRRWRGLERPGRAEQPGAKRPSEPRRGEPERREEPRARLRVRHQRLALGVA
jgi:hypothetical protein